MSNAKHYFWSTLNRFGNQAIAFIGNVLIARLLSPDDYGLVAMLSIFIGIAWNFTESGFADCLIRKKDADKKDFSTVLIFNLVAGTFMYFMIYFTAPYIAKYFERTELIYISRIIGFSILIKAITETEFTRLRKELEFKTTTIIDLVSNTTAITVAYIMALRGFGYWALVLQTLTIGCTNIFMLIVLTKWKPYLFFSWKRFKNMSGYSFNMLLSYIFNQIGENLYSVFIGKFQSANSLGFYRQAQKISDAPISGLNAIILSTVYPLLAKETDEVKRYKMYDLLFNKFLFIQFLIVTFLFGIAYPLINIVFGEKWIVSAPYFQLMLIASLIYPISTLNSNIAKIYDKSRLYRNLSFLRNVFLLIALTLTMKQSIQIILYGQIVASYISVIVYSVLCGRIINLGFQKQLNILINQLWIPLSSMAVSYFSIIFFTNSILNLFIYTSAYLTIYITINEIVKQKQYCEFKLDIFSHLRSYFQFK